MKILVQTTVSHVKQTVTGFIYLIFLGLSVGLDSWIYSRHPNLLWAAGGISFMFITNQQFERTEGFGDGSQLWCRFA